MHAFRFFLLGMAQLTKGAPNASWIEWPLSFGNWPGHQSHSARITNVCVFGGGSPFTNLATSIPNFFPLGFPWPSDMCVCVSGALCGLWAWQFRCALCVLKVRPFLFPLRCLCCLLLAFFKSLGSFFLVICRAWFHLVSFWFHFGFTWFLAFGLGVLAFGFWFHLALGFWLLVFVFLAFGFGFTWFFTWLLAFAFWLLVFWFHLACGFVFTCFFLHG